MAYAEQPVEDAEEICPSGAHEPAWDPDAGETVCVVCDRPGSELVGERGHRLY